MDNGYTIKIRPVVETETTERDRWEWYVIGPDGWPVDGSTAMGMVRALDEARLSIVSLIA